MSKNRKPFLFLMFSILFLMTRAFADSRWIREDTGVKTSISDVCFIDKHTGWAVGWPEVILHTRDGGNTWERQYADRGKPSVGFNGVFFVDHNTGWIVGDHNVVLKTDNGGLTWLEQDIGLKPVRVGPILRDYDFFGVHFLDRNNGWIVGFFGRILLHTENGGLTWEVQKTGANHILWGVRFIDGDNGWAVGSHGTILHTKTGGRNRYLLFKGWEKQDSGIYGDLYGIYFVNKNTGWAVGESGAIMTTDGGRHWERKKLNIKAYVLKSVYFIDEWEGWIAGWGGIFHTTDGGKSWQPELIGREYDLIKVFFIDRNNGWVTGGYGKLFRYMR
jgi:photosystem II stability/assembly factor-like uncharacterized protein